MKGKSRNLRKQSAFLLATRLADFFITDILKKKTTFYMLHKYDNFMLTVLILI